MNIMSDSPKIIPLMKNDRSRCLVESDILQSLRHRSFKRPTTALGADNKIDHDPSFDFQAGSIVTVFAMDEGRVKFLFGLVRFKIDFIRIKLLFSFVRFGIDFVCRTGTRPVFATVIRMINLTR